MIDSDENIPEVCWIYSRNIFFFVRVLSQVMKGDLHFLEI